MVSINYNYLRPKKSRNLKDRHDKEFVFRSDLKALSYKNATILHLKSFAGDNLLFGRGGVVDENGKYVDISAIDRRVQFSYDADVINTENRRVVYCGYLVNHWGHFLVEAVQRLWYFLKNDSNVDCYVFFINTGEERIIKGNYREFFELLGVWDKIEIINKPTKYKEVIVPELSYKWCSYYSQECKDVFNKVATNIKIKPEWGKYDKIFFTRSQLPNVSKLEFGLDMIDEFFLNNGYKILSPEKSSLSELIYLIRNAKECASISGSLPHNMLFGLDNQKLIIVERNTLNNEIQVDINQIKNLSVIYIDSNIAIYPISLSYGPFILSYKGYLEQYAKDNNLKGVNEKYYSESYMKKCFKNYMVQYKKAYGYQWFMDDWAVIYTDYLREAYLDSLKYFGDYITRVKPYKFSHYFQLHYIKQFIKKIIKR